VIALKRSHVSTRFLLDLFLSILSGMLLVLSFPPFDYQWLAPFALTPLLIVAARRFHSSAKFISWNTGTRFLFGWIAGVVFWFGVCRWIEFVLHEHGYLSSPLAWFSFSLFCVLKAIHMGFFVTLAGPLMERWYALPAVALLWAGIERTHGTFGFAWLALGNAAIDMSLPLRLAPFTGVYGVSFVLAMLSVALSCVLLRSVQTSRPTAKQPTDSPHVARVSESVVREFFSRNRIVMAPLLALLLLLLLPPVPGGMPATERALVVQPNVDPETQWTSENWRAFENRLIAVSKSAAAPLVVWPELPAPLYYYDDADFQQSARGLARDRSFLFGTVAYTANHEPLNSAVLLNPGGKEAGRYDKIYLVPFGEFIPPLFSWVNRISHEIGDFVPGHEVKVLNAPVGRIGVFICYESAFPHLVRRFPAHGADVLFNLSNDGYFGHSAAYPQHLSLVRMRAVENRRFIVRCTNDGISAVIDPAGRIRRRLPAYTLSAAMLPYGRVGEQTFYTRTGDWFAWGALALGLFLSVLAARHAAS
jgi:apolipoprotein N-acyltransferase